LAVGETLQVFTAFRTSAECRKRNFGLGNARKRSGGSVQRSQPAQQEKVVAAQGATVRPQEPMDGLLQGVAYAYASKINRFAMRTTHGEHDFLASFLTVGFCCATGTLHMIAPERGHRISHITVAGAAASGCAAGISGRLDLFRRSKVGLGKLHPLPLAGNLTLVSFR
jgi:hypothetical protein